MWRSLAENTVHSLSTDFAFVPFSFSFFHFLFPSIVFFWFSFLSFPITFFSFAWFPFLSFIFVLALFFFSSFSFCFLSFPFVSFPSFSSYSSTSAPLLFLLLFPLSVTRRRSALIFWAFLLHCLRFLLQLGFSSVLKWKHQKTDILPISGITNDRTVYHEISITEYTFIRYVHKTH